jgi:hypothetical protein
MLSHSDAWISSFSSLLSIATAHRADGCKHKDFVAALVLQIAALTARAVFTIKFPTLLGPSSVLCPRLRKVTEDCLEILDLAKQVSVESAIQSSVFVLDCGHVSALFVIMTSPVEISIKEDALELMKDIRPRREGTWDSVVLSKAGAEYIDGRRRTEFWGGGKSTSNTLDEADRINAAFEAAGCSTATHGLRKYTEIISQPSASDQG